MKLKELLTSLEKKAKELGIEPPMLCGGTPRDRYMGKLENVSDIDITNGTKTISYLSQEFYQELKKKYNITFKSMPDGHSSIFIGSLKMDFSSNFNVPGIENILREKKILHPTDMQKEMFSRDFTCNALLLSLDLKNLVDPTHQGFKDIKDKKIRTCLSPNITLTTNKNRVIRAIYLSSKLQFEIDKEIIEYVKGNPESVKISTDKVLSEKLNQAFEFDADRAVNNLNKMNLWNYIPISEKVYPYYLRRGNGK